MIKVEKTEKTEKINHYKQIVKSLYLTNIAIQNYNLTQKEKEKKMRKSNCCKAELLPRTVLCSKCLSEVKIEKLTAEDFIDLDAVCYYSNIPLSELCSLGTLKLKERDKEDIQNAINAINNNIGDITEKISKYLKDNWTIDRISKIDKALLILAIYEIQYKEIPFKVVINEVVELAKKYGEDTSASFINGVLANVVKELNIE